jgi:hypothetical protein
MTGAGGNAVAASLKMQSATRKGVNPAAHMLLLLLLLPGA